ncbi:hypothetical protein LTR95_010031 [Oleoguttula sp. CCFEE 5521]
MLPARDDSHRQYPPPSEPLSAYLHDLMLVAEYYEARCDETAGLVAEHVPELQRLRTILRDPCKAASVDPRLRSGIWLTPWEWRTLWPWIGRRVWRWKDAKVPIADPLVRHLSFGCPVAQAAKSRVHLTNRVQKLWKIRPDEARWLEQLSHRLPKGNSSDCRAALYVVVRFSSSKHTHDNLLKVEIRMSDPMDDSRKTTRHTHCCSLPVLDTHVWQKPLPAFLMRTLEDAPMAANGREEDWHRLNTEFMFTGSLVLISPFARIQGMISADGIACSATLSDSARGKLGDGSNLPFDISIPWMALAPKPQATDEATNEAASGATDEAPAMRGPGILKFFSHVKKPVTAAPLLPADTSMAMVPHDSAHVPIPGHGAAQQPIATKFSQSQSHVLDLEVMCPSSPPGTAEPASADGGIRREGSVIPALGEMPTSPGSSRPSTTTIEEAATIDCDAHEDTLIDGQDGLEVSEHAPPSSPRLALDLEDIGSGGTQNDHALSSYTFSDPSDYGECFTSDPITLQQTLDHLELSTPSTSPATFAGGTLHAASGLAGQESARELMRSDPVLPKPQISLHVTTMDKTAGRTTALQIKTLDENTSFNIAAIDRLRQQNALRVDEAFTSRRPTTSETSKTPRLRSASGRFQSARSDKATTLHTQLSVLDEKSSQRKQDKIERWIMPVQMASHRMHPLTPTFYPYHHEQSEAIPRYQTPHQV